MTNIKMHVRCWLVVFAVVSCAALLVQSKALPREERDDNPDIYDIILDKLVSIVFRKARSYVLSFIPDFFKWNPFG